MKKKVYRLLESKFIKKHKAKIILVIGLILSGTVGVSAATIIFASSEVSFDKTTAGAAGMTATTVQQAIDEVAAEASYCPFPLYKQIGVVTSGDGLYADSIESGRYIYKGANPNNYICLGDLSGGTCPENSLYRIISIESDGAIKVIKNTALSSMVWEPSYSTSISGVTASNSVNGTRYSSTSTDYCYVSSNSSYYGCSSWGSKTSTYASDGTTKVTTMSREVGGTTYTLPTYDAYINVYLNGGKYLTTSSSGNSSTYQTITGWINGDSTGLNSTAKSKVLFTKAFNVGSVSDKSSYTLADNRTQEAQYKWYGKVGLINVTDYVAASTNSNCTSLYNYTSNSNCYNDSSTHNWLYFSGYYWTLSRSSRTENYVVWYVAWQRVSTQGIAFTNIFRPVLYLSSDITLTGSGTNDGNVYRISS